MSTFSAVIFPLGFQPALIYWVLEEQPFIGFWCSFTIGF